MFQIAVMQTELRELQPRLIETSKETEQLIVVIEKETVEVEQVKAVVEADKAVADEAAAGAKAIKVGLYFCLSTLHTVKHQILVFGYVKFWPSQSRGGGGQGRGRRGGGWRKGFQGRLYFCLRMCYEMTKNTQLAKN